MGIPILQVYVCIRTIVIIRTTYSPSQRDKFYFYRSYLIAIIKILLGKRYNFNYESYDYRSIVEDVVNWG